VPGKFLDVSEHLGAEGINIRAISVADTSDVSTVRFVADDPEKTTNVLRSHGYSVKETAVIAVEVPDHPGGLQAVLKPLKRNNINVKGTTLMSTISIPIWAGEQAGSP
jgi:hypothetical protein